MFPLRWERVDVVSDTQTTCDECGLTYFYAPKYHECAHKSDPAMLAAVERARGESWADECVRRVMAPR